MKEVARQKDHVYLFLGQRLQEDKRQRAYVFGAGKSHDFVKRAPAIVLANGIPLFVTYMVIGSNQDADRVGVCKWLTMAKPRRKELPTSVLCGHIASADLVKFHLFNHIQGAKMDEPRLKKSRV